MTILAFKLPWKTTICTQIEYLPDISSGDSTEAL